MPEIILHELLDRQHSLGPFVAEQFGHSHLLGPIQRVLRFARVKMEFIAHVQQEFARAAERPLIVFRDHAHAGLRLGIRLSVTRKTDPADKMQIA